MTAKTTPDPDDPYWRAQDAALLRAMRGCTFGEGFTLPSGRFITGDEAEIWQELET
jgi:hypothetical protein